MFASEYPGGFGELYDLERDPWEMENLYFKPEFAAVVRDLHDELLNWLVTTARPRTAQGVKPLRPEQATERYKCCAYADGTLSPEDVRSALAAGRRNYL
jgi:hypothetical protein